MRADICTTVTLDTVFRLPYRDIYCDTTFLVCGGTGRSCSVYEILECGYRQRVSFLRSNFGLDVVYEFNNFLGALVCMCGLKSFVCCVLPAFRNFYFFYLLSTCIDCCPVLGNDIVTFTSVGSFCKLLSSVRLPCPAE